MSIFLSKIYHAGLKIGFTLILFLLPTTYGFPLKFSSGSLINDGQVQNFLHDLFKPVLRHYPRTPLIHFYLIYNDTLNAFVADNESIVLHTGIFQRCTSVGELMGILLHELGHMKGHHIFHQVQMKESSKRQIILPCILGAILSGASRNPGGILSGLVIGKMKALTTELSHSREHEHFADKFALDTFLKIKWPIRFFSSIMKRLAEKESEASPLYLRTHPFCKERLAMALAYPQEGHIPPELEKEFQRIKMKIIAALSPIPQAKNAIAYGQLSAMAPALKDYGHAIVSYRQGKTLEALTYLDRFEKEDGASAFTYELRAQILFESNVGYKKKALEMIEKAQELRPWDPWISLTYAQILLDFSQEKNPTLRLKASQKVITLLEPFIVSCAFNPELWYWLAIAYGHAHKEGYMRTAFAEYYLLCMQKKEALFHAKKACLLLPPSDSHYKRAYDIVQLIEQKKI